MSAPAEGPRYGGRKAQREGANQTTLFYVLVSVVLLRSWLSGMDFLVAAPPYIVKVSGTSIVEMLPCRVYVRQPRAGHHYCTMLHLRLSIHLLCPLTNMMGVYQDEKAKNHITLVVKDQNGAFTHPSISSRTSSHHADICGDDMQRLFMVLQSVTANHPISQQADWV